MNHMLDVKRTERGWPGHYCLAHKCLFHRNTLLESGDVAIVVSTVGLLQTFNKDVRAPRFDTIRYETYFETAAFHVQPTRWKGIDATRQVGFASPSTIGVADADDQANDMHERVVQEITERIARGSIEP